jgi:hypothetical protein
VWRRTTAAEQEFVVSDVQHRCSTYTNVLEKLAKEQLQDPVESRTMCA